VEAVITPLRDALGVIWRFHFSIPEPAYWLVVVVSGMGFSSTTPTEALAWTGSFLVGIQGIARWHHHRGRGRRAVVIARFSAATEFRGRAIEAQELMLTRLRDMLSTHDASSVHDIPASISPAHGDRAMRLRRRLRARLLVYGRVAASEGSWGVFARLVTPVGGGEHLDPHTRDATPIKRSWADRVDLLSPTERVQTIEYPITAAAELEILVRASSGQAALALGDPTRAQELLESALRVWPESESTAIDGVRVALAESQAQQGHAKAALEGLQARLASDNASPDLLRTASRLMAAAASVGDIEDGTAYDASVELLQRAAKHESDPQHDMTTFNLASLLGARDKTREDAAELLKELVASSSRYRRAWYAHRLLGSDAWRRANEAISAGDRGTARLWFGEAGRRYRRAIHLRPRIRFFAWMGNARVLWTRYPPAAILDANLADVHDAMDCRWRSRWRWARCERKREALLRRGFRRFAAGQWQLAYANFDWAFVGRGDFRDTVALVYLAVAAYQYGNDEEALAAWKSAVSCQPFAMVTRAAMLRDPEAHPLERGLPGDEPTDLDEITDLLGLPRLPPGPCPPGVGTLRGRLTPRHESTGGDERLRAGLG